MLPGRTIPTQAAARVTRRALLGCALVGILGAWALPAEALPPQSDAETPSWSVETSAFADLWYHGLAVVGFNGFGPAPLYDMAYGRRARRTRGDAPLIREAEAFRAAFQADPAFEVLHFAPVYLLGATVEQGLEGLRRVATGRSLDPSAGPWTVGAAALARILSTPTQREILGNWVDVLLEEIRLGVADDLAASRSERLQRLSALEERWARFFVPALAEYLNARELDRGAIVVTPALGIEGRLGPDSASGTVVMVGWTDADPDELLSSVVRELCFPTVRAAFQAVESRYSDRVMASRASDAAATRCGELLVEAVLPETLPAYRRRFGLTGAPASAWSALPDQSVNGAWDSALRRELNLERGS